MDYIDNFNPAYDDNDFNSYSREHKILEDAKKLDRGYNVITRKCKKVQSYTSGSIGSQIRNAETGEYYQNIVCSGDEDLFYKVILATGECKSKNNSNILFYTSPHHYMSHTGYELEPDLISLWETKRNARLKKIELVKQPNMSSFVTVK